MHLLVGGSPWEVLLYLTSFRILIFNISYSLILQKEGPRTTGLVPPQDLEHVRVHIFVPAVRFVSFKQVHSQVTVREGVNAKKNVFFRALPE